MADIKGLEQRYGLAAGGPSQSPRRARRRLRRRLLVRRLIQRRIRYYLAMTASLLAVSAMLAGSVSTEGIRGRDFAGRHWREHLRSLADYAPQALLFGLSKQAAITVALVVIAAALWLSLADRRR